MSLPRTLRLKQNYITNASRNATEALSMALHLSMRGHAERKQLRHIQALVQLLNANALALRSMCEHVEDDINFPEEAK